MRSMPPPLLHTGLDVLLRDGAASLRGRRVGLLTHAGATDRQGRPALDALRALPGFRLAAVFGPEHGLAGTAAAGAPVPSEPDSALGVPVFSLYGASVRPAPDMLRGLDVVLCDLQDIGVRCYTYVSTLRHMLEAAAEAGIPVVVADRPIPLPRVVDGPMLDPTFESFVGAVPVPLAYGMTPGETARWLRATKNLDLDLDVIRMEGFTREVAWGIGRRRWVAPSPGLRSWSGAACYAGTVLAEALPALDLRRGSLQSFEGLAAPWMRPGSVAERMQAFRLPGCRAELSRYHVARRGFRGLRIRVSDPHAFRPVLTGVALLTAIADEHGLRAVWAGAEAKTAAFDRLAGTDALRRALRRGERPADIAAAWAAPLAAFREQRADALLYGEDPSIRRGRRRSPPKAHRPAAAP